MQTWRLAVKSNPAVLGATVGCDAVIASYGPISTILLGAELSRQYKKPYIVDIRDSFKAMEKKSFFPSSWFSRRLEKRLLATSSERTTVGVNLGKFLKDQYNLNFQPIYNGWSDRDMLVHSGEDRQRVGRKEKPYLYYAGTLYPHRLKALSLVLKALRHVDLRLRLRIVNYHIASILQRFVEAHDVCDQVDLWSPVSTEIVSNEMALSEGLLVLENVLPTSLHDGNVTGKLLGVLASGVPGVAVCSPTSEIQRIVEDVEGWSAVSTEMACLDAIRALIRGPRSVVSRKGIGAYHVTAQAKNLRDVIERAVASGSERR